MIKFLDLQAVNAAYAAEIEEAVLRVARSGWYLRGAETERFEAAYAQYATAMGFKGKTDDEKVDALIKGIEDLKKKLNIPSSIKGWFALRNEYTEEDFKKAMETLPTLAFDDQCTGANPRYPLIKEIKKVYEMAFEGTTDFDF